MKTALKKVLDSFIVAIIELDKKEGTNFSQHINDMTEAQEKKVLGYIQRDLRKQLIHVTQEGGHHEHP